MKLAGAIIAGFFAAVMPSGDALADGQPGDFDFYVLSLSWSPSFCEAEGQNGRSAECASGRPYAFIVHGLWPQYEHGFPRNCSAYGSVDGSLADGMLDLMADPGLVRHEWQAHGTCSGLSPSAYFDTVRAARDRVKIPDVFEHVDRYVMTTPMAVEAAFVMDNPGLRNSGVAVTCDRRRLREVRICLTRTLGFRACPEIDDNGCRQPSVVLPPVR